MKTSLIKIAIGILFVFASYNTISAGYLWYPCDTPFCEGTQCKVRECYYYCSTSSYYVTTCTRITCCEGGWEVQGTLCTNYCIMRTVNSSSCSPSCGGSSCNNCTPPACPTGYTETNTGLGTTQTQCDRGSGCNPRYNTRTCYCTNCTPVCPTGLTLTNTTYPVTTASCTRTGTGCGTRTSTCYENSSPQPTPYITLNSPAGTSTDLGFTSTTASGESANNPLNVATSAVDANGVDDIESIAYWFQLAATTPATPSYIDLDENSGQAPRTTTTNSWGFMLHKEGSSWVPYIPSMNGTANDKWVKAQKFNNALLGDYFDIAGPTGSPMVQVQNLVVTVDVTTGVRATYKLHFLDTNQIVSGNYRVYIMANDKFGFTPYDNYLPVVNNNWNPEQIRYPQQWIYKRNWYIDLQPPSIGNMDISFVDDSLKLDWSSLTDTPTPQQLYGIVGNIYIDTEDPSSIEEITVNSGGNLTSFTPDTLDTVGEETGHLSMNAGKTFKVLGTSTSGSVTIDIGDNEQGTLVFYLTLFDTGGNTNQKYLTFSLEDWMVTEGGLVYSSGGYSLTVRDLSGLGSDPWGSNPLSQAGFSYTTADISSEMFGSNLLTVPVGLLHSTDSESYELSEIGLQSEDIYTKYKSVFDVRLPVLITKFVISDTGLDTLTGDMCGATDGCYKYHISESNLIVNSDFVCNGKGIFFVEGNLGVNPSILNSASQRDSCIFIVKGGVSILPGSNSADNYDVINAFIVANGIVSIKEDSNGDGLLVNGGIYSPNHEIDIERSIDLADRNTLPVFAVSHHSKYGVFSKEIFGNEVNIVKTEVGFKPY